MPLADPAAALVRLARDVYAPAPLVHADVWADKERVLIERAAAEPGKWRTARTPYLRRIMRVCSSHGEGAGVRHVTFRKASQIGGTECFYNVLFTSIDVDPGPTLLVYPTVQDAREIYRDRLLPTIKATPAVARHMSGVAEEESGLHIKFDRMDLWVVGSNAASRLRAKPIRRAFVDDAGVCAPHTIDELLQRGATFEDFKLFENGTPGFAGSDVDASLQVSTNERYEVPCPHPGCGVYQELVFERLRWHGGLGPAGGADRAHLDSIERPGGTWYECRACRGKIYEQHKGWMLERGVWVAEGEVLPKGNGGGRSQTEGDGGLDRIPPSPSVSLNPPSPSHVGFRISALYSPFAAVTWGRIAREWVGQRGKPSRIWVNGVLGLPQKSGGLGLRVDQLRPLRIPVSAGGYRLGTVPSWVVCLVGAIDVQGDRVYASLWGFSAQARDSALVYCAQVRSPERTGLVQVDQLLQRAWPVVHAGDPTQTVVKRVRCLVWGADSGHRTTEVYSAVRRWSPGRDGSPSAIGGHRLAYAIKGSSTRLSAGHTTTRIEKMPDGRPIAGGLVLVNVDGFVWKEAVSGRLRASLGLSVDDDADSTEEDGATGKDGKETGENPERKNAPALHGSDAVRVVSSEGDSDQDRVTIGRIFLPEDTPDEFLEHLVSEELITEARGRQVVRFWRPRVAGVRNDFWDTAVYAEALASLVGLNRLGGPPGPPGGQRTESREQRPGAGLAGGGGGGGGGRSKIRSGYR